MEADAKAKEKSEEPVADARSAPGSQEVKIKGAVSSDVGNGGEVDVLVSLKPPEGGARQPTDIICVIDVSGSMSQEATLQNEQGVSESQGLSILDITKHSVRTIISMLLACDRFGLVAYSTQARTVLELTTMDEDGRKAATDACEALKTEATTNIWAGLLQGLEIAKSGEARDRLSHVLLLTDGQPTVHPQKGPGTEVEMLREYRDTNKSLPCTISTFGFGYSLNSKMLKEIAVEGGGSYAFIPDGGMVGTVFVNATSNLLSTLARNAELSLEAEEGEFLEENNGVVGDHLVTRASWGLCLNVGTLQYGQSKDVVVRMKLPAAPQGEAKEYLHATLKCVSRSSEGDKAEGEITDRKGSPEVAVHVNRLTAAATIRETMDELSKNTGRSQDEKDQAIRQAGESIKACLSKIRETKAAEDSRTKSLLEDLEGQVSQAFSRMDWFIKWGRHYLPSLAGAHLSQQCNNFKDPGVQSYAGTMFSELRDEADEKFLQLPPPTPTARRMSYGGGGYSAGSSAPVNMSAFYNAGGG